eukprot:TRINITY_DN1766_c0_g1_i1.p1 TRINITY_DN1766_c0_g1~~TRINITY_DN1766_c0_g1_i1.p1  ORF type:complete len:133 (+),score=15.47 TRINITY_DN1766_c0_g1_i1:362-760(+)
MKCGIPPSERGHAWQLLSGSKRIMASAKTTYTTLLKEMNPCVLNCIELDTCRTFRDRPLYQDRMSPKHLELYRLLKAYSNYDPEVGYSSGMSDIAAVLLMFMPEEDAFWVFVQMMTDPHYDLRGFFKPAKAP